MLRVASCDSQGSVYIGDSTVYRKIASAHAGNVKEVLAVIGDGIEGVVETTVCDPGNVPSELKTQASQLMLAHKRVSRISYPHEWSATMLRDAAVFHLELSERLLHKGITLKDAHPWNILFDHGRPVFVDFTSLVTNEGLFSEEYLESNRTHRDMPADQRMSLLVHEIFTRMYQPYFINPLLLYSCGVRHLVRMRIEDTTLNASTSVITARECLPRGRIGRGILRKMFRYFMARRDEERIFSRLRETCDLHSFYADIQRYVQNLEVALGGSAYSAYYQQKGEDQDFVYSDAWNAKQKSVHDALNSPNIRSVLDVACNTGWFALMAERLGKSVVAFDIDEGCIEALYSQVRQSRLDVLPLVMNFTELTKDRYSIYDGNKVLINAEQRLRSDSVIALGIIHHLVLGLGLSFDEVLDSLAMLCVKQLIIEFVDPDDAMIQGEPSFFPAYFSNRALMLTYDMQKLIAKLVERGFEVDVHASYPDTRKILVCTKRVLE